MSTYIVIPKVINQTAEEYEPAKGDGKAGDWPVFYPEVVETFSFGLASSQEDIKETITSQTSSMIATTSLNGKTKEILEKEYGSIPYAVALTFDDISEEQYQSLPHQAQSLLLESYSRIDSVIDFDKIGLTDTLSQEIIESASVAFESAPKEM